MPLPPPGAGAPPPGMPGAPPMPGTGTGPVAAPSPLAGNAQSGMTGVKVGLEALQKALPQIPMGSKLHTAVLKAVADIGKKLNEEGGGGGDKAGAIQQLIEAMRNAKTNPNAQAALPQGGPPPAPAMPAPMPPMGG